MQKRHSLRYNEDATREASLCLACGSIPPTYQVVHYLAYIERLSIAASDFIRPAN